MHQPVLTDADGIRRQILAANSSDRCIGVIAWMHTFSPAKMWIAGLVALQKPLLHLHSQFHRELPWSEIDMDYMNLHQSAHGDREFAHLLTRMRVRRKTVAGHVDDPGVGERIGTWVRAAAGWHEAHSLRVVRFGDNMRDVAVTDGDKVEAQVQLGFSVDGHGVGDLVAASSAAPPEIVEALLADYADQYELAAELRPGGARRDSLVAAARIEAGLRAFLDDHGSQAFTDTFEDLHGMPQLPGIAAQRLMTDGFGFGAEGDWKAAALVRILKVMARGLPGRNILHGGLHLRPRRRVARWCSGPTCSRSAPRSRPPGRRAKSTRYRSEDATTRSGSCSRPPRALHVLVSLVDLGDRFRLIANEVEVIAPPESLPKLPVARAVWRPLPDFTTATEEWLLAGGSHHSVFTAALGLDAIADFAEIAGVELVTIGAESRPA